jgi:hypothetical protein
MSLVIDFGIISRHLTAKAEEAIVITEREHGDYSDPVYLFMTIMAMSDSSVVKAIATDSSPSAVKLSNALLTQNVSAIIAEANKSIARLPIVGSLTKYRSDVIDRLVTLAMVSASLRGSTHSIQLSDLLVGVIMSDSYLMRWLLKEIGCDKYELLIALGADQRLLTHSSV